MADRAARKGTKDTLSQHCRIAEFLRVDISAAANADAVHAPVRPCGEAPQAGTSGRCCDPGECPNAKLMFELMFDGIDMPERARMH
ncbi:MAG: hypothetical protein FJX62_09125 [Alphaproteobacteria bacterium]|nr:hypothetical protein [Alphaproteobacteria bacterium]